MAQTTRPFKLPTSIEGTDIACFIGCLFGHAHEIVAHILQEHPRGIFTRTLLQNCLLPEQDVLFVLADLYNTGRILSKSGMTIMDTIWKLHPIIDLTHLHTMQNEALTTLAQFLHHRKVRTTGRQCVWGRTSLQNILKRRRDRRGKRL